MVNCRRRTGTDCLGLLMRLGNRRGNRADTDRTASGPRVLANVLCVSTHGPCVGQWPVCPGQRSVYRPLARACWPKARGCWPQARGCWPMARGCWPMALEGGNQQHENLASSPHTWPEASDRPGQLPACSAGGPCVRPEAREAGRWPVCMSQHV